MSTVNTLPLNKEQMLDAMQLLVVNDYDIMFSEQSWPFTMCFVLMPYNHIREVADSQDTINNKTE
jgi:hypothetical protein